MKSIKETKELLIFVARLGNSIDEAMKDGKVNFTDITTLYAPIMSAKDALNGIAEVPEEIKDLDEAEIQELMAAVAEELELESAQTEALIEKGLELGLQLIDFISELRNQK